MVSYIDYRTLNDVYTIDETCELLGMQKQDVKAKCEQLNIRPSRGANGVGCFTKYDIRRLHNALYCEDHEKWDPWA